MELGDKWIKPFYPEVTEQAGLGAFPRFGKIERMLLGWSHTNLSFYPGWGISLLRSVGGWAINISFISSIGVGPLIRGLHIPFLSPIWFVRSMSLPLALLVLLASRRLASATGPEDQLYLFLTGVTGLIPQFVLRPDPKYPRWKGITYQSNP